MKRRLSDVLQKKHEPSTEKGTRGSKKPGFVYLSFVRMFLEFAFVRRENKDPSAGSPELDN